MGLLLLLIGVIGIVGASWSADNGKCKLKARASGGTLLKKMLKNSREACRHACNNHDDCVFWSWNDDSPENEHKWRRQSPLQWRSHPSHRRNLDLGLQKL